MLRESNAVRQIPGEPNRRWFWDELFDLLVWNEDEEIVGFQLAYESPIGPRVLTWRKEQGYAHQAIDEGDLETTKVGMTRLLVNDGEFDQSRLMREFEERASQIDVQVVAGVLERMREFAKG